MDYKDFPSSVGRPKKIRKVKSGDGICLTEKLEPKEEKCDMGGDPGASPFDCCQKYAGPDNDVTYKAAPLGSPIKSQQMSPHSTFTQWKLNQPKKSAPETNWRDKYMLLQAELVDETQRWARRYENMVAAFEEKILEVRNENDAQVMEGYDQAFKMIMEERDRRVEAEKEVAALKKQLNRG